MDNNNRPVLYPFKRLLYSRKFLLLVLDTVVSIALHFFGGADAVFLIGALQAMFIAVITGITAEDYAEKKNGG